MPKRKLYKTEIVIWSEYDPSHAELDILAVDAIAGDSYCSKQVTTTVMEPEKDKDWDGTEFFD